MEGDSKEVEHFHSALDMFIDKESGQLEKRH